MAPGLAGWTRTGPHCILRPVNPAARSVNESQPGRGTAVQARPGPERASRLHRFQLTRGDGATETERFICAPRARHGSPLSPAAVRSSHFSPFFSYRSASPPILSSDFLSPSLLLLLLLRLPPAVVASPPLSFLRMADVERDGGI